jgi:hypothetical protein
VLPRNRAPSVADVLRQLTRHPIDGLVRRWNWKSALLSAVSRAVIFFAANLSAGWRAASAAFATELLFRACTSGFYGAMTAAFVPVRPVWAAAAATMILLPVVSHSLELAVHVARGTPELARSIAASVTFTVVSTGFSLFAMRRGALVVGPGCGSLTEDLRRTPRLIGAFAGAIIRAAGTLCRDRRLL